MTSPWLRRSVAARDLWTAARAGLWVLLLFAGGLLLVRFYGTPLRSWLLDRGHLGLVVFAATSALAVVLPLASNLPLVPLAVLAWGPGVTAAALLAGWVAGSWLSFLLARRVGSWLLRRFPGVRRHADIDRLVHPRWPLLSLVSLRMTFPVDVLSYALGLFSTRTSPGQVALSTAIGAAPFALLFAWFPALPASGQALVFAASVVVFGVHLWWVLHRAD